MFACMNPGAARARLLTLSREVEQRWHFLAIWQPRSLNTQLIEEFVDQRLGCAISSALLFVRHSRETGSRCVLEQVTDESNRIGGCTGSEDLGERVRLDLREFVLHVLACQLARSNRRL